MMVFIVTIAAIINHIKIKQMAFRALPIMLSRNGSKHIPEIGLKHPITIVNQPFRYDDMCLFCSRSIVCTTDFRNGKSNSLLPGRGITKTSLGPGLRFR